MDYRAFIYAFLSAFLMGTIGVFSKLTGLPAEVVTFFRLFIGAIFVMIFLGATGRIRLLLMRPSISVCLNGCFLAGFIIFYVQAMNYTSMANSIMLVYLAPVFASVIAHFFLRERLNMFSSFLICFAMFGFAMMMEFRLDFTAGSNDFIGICLGIASLFCYAGFILVNRLIPIEMHVFTSTFYQLLVGGMIMIPFMLPVFGQVQMEHIPWLLGIGFFPGFLGICFAVIALRRLEAAVFGTIAYVEPVAVVVFGWTIFNEYLNPLQLSGCALIILSGILRAVINEKKPLVQEDPECI